MRLDPSESHFLKNQTDLNFEPNRSFGKIGCSKTLFLA